MQELFALQRDSAPHDLDTIIDDCTVVRQEDGIEVQSQGLVLLKQSIPKISVCFLSVSCAAPNPILPQNCPY